MREIDYYKNNEILENSYYQIPQELFVNSLYKEKLNSDVQNLISDTIIDADREMSVNTSRSKQKYKTKKYQINYKE